MDFFSYPVIAAFTTAAAIEIASSQVKTVLGIKGDSDSFLDSWKTVINHGSEFKKWDLILGCTTIMFLIAVKVKHLNKRSFNRLMRSFLSGNWEKIWYTLL